MSVRINLTDGLADHKDFRTENDSMRMQSASEPPMDSYVSKPAMNAFS